MFLVANSLSWTSSAIPKISTFSKEEIGNLGNFFFYGNVLGSAMSFFTLVYLPRKMSLILNEIVLLISWILVFFKNDQSLLYVARFLAGVACSSIGLNLPVYEAECFHVRMI